MIGKEGQMETRNIYTMSYQNCDLLEKKSPEKLKLLLEVCVGMVQPKENINYPFWYYQREPGETLILDESIYITIRDKQIIGWMFTFDEQINKLNLGTSEEPHIMLISVALLKEFKVKVKLLTKYNDVFAWGYRELKGIPRSICEHKIELTTNTCPIINDPIK
jgi:hypothetical protein